MGLEDRLKRLEVRGADATSEWIVPIEVRVHLRAVQRYHALEDGRELPPYTQEEVETLRRWDLETVSGSGVEAVFRNDPGWQSEEDRELLDSWEEGARRRLAAADGLPPERWGEVWGADDDDDGGGVVIKM